MSVKCGISRSEQHTLTLLGRKEEENAEEEGKVPIAIKLGEANYALLWAQAHTHTLKAVAIELEIRKQSTESESTLISIRGRGRKCLDQVPI